MRAVIVCESMFGSTKKVAEAIAEGLADCAEVSVVPVTSADAHILDGADLVVVGGPAHHHGMSRPSTGKRAGSRGARLSWYRARSAARECANGSHRPAGWRSPEPLSIPGSRGCRRFRPGVEVHPPAPRPPWGAHRGVTGSFLVEGLTGALAGGELGRARGWGERPTQ